MWPDILDRQKHLKYLPELILANLHLTYTWEANRAINNDSFGY
jgi:hypothetical protein